MNSKTSAGGVGFYILDNIDFRTRNDLELSISQDVEDCWIEIQRSKQNNIVIGCIYRHPSQNRDSFHEAIESQLNKLNKTRADFVLDQSAPLFTFWSSTNQNA